MSKRVVIGMVSLAGLLVALLGLDGLPAAQAQDTKVKPPLWLHGLDMRCRKGGEPQFTKDTKQYGIEAFRDENNTNLIYVTETGAMAVGAGKDLKSTGDNKAKPPLFLHGLDMRVRKGGEGDFTDKTRKFGAEAFKDENANTLTYISETGFLTCMPAAGDLKPQPEGKAKPPIWMHAVELRCRRAGESEFTKETMKFGIEVFKDENANTLLYISDAGAVAVLNCPADLKPVPEGKAKAPIWLHGMDLKCRKADEGIFSKDTKSFGVECFKDENADNLIFISEKGAIAVVPAKGYKKGPDDKVKAPDWKHGLDLRVRKGGDVDFNKAAKYGVECFVDANTGNGVYVSEVGAIAVMPK